ncbi:hypothetical protein [Agrococcus sp. DT81.2]|uniref:hypothetical protein n=1 Tax=Agrococcus sp. DT81.2 TaxID=3393414 RepID=UPI003CE55816
MAPRRERQRRLQWILVAVIIAQIAVPAIALTQEKPARFGFQMYSGYGEGSITVLDDGGREIDVDMGALLPRALRPELDWTRHVPAHLCAEVPRAATVVVEQDLTGRAAVPCD